MHRPAPMEVTYRNMRFLVTHNPTSATLNKFLEELKKYGVLDRPFDDGSSPSNQTVDNWLSLVNIKFREEPGCCTAVRCVAGPGRTPVLVALALIEGGMKSEDAVQFVRQKRHGALTASDSYLYLEKYRSTMLLHFKDSSHRNNCSIQ
ncbi:protein tyrosine phosphatase type IVA 1-like isoform X2 [Diceros bicornis minor]|uniref:protein tyrosine phosphatase type IVA 1-like isoform X2 n=1 Tax=Diceros bicornis minor TaxID=77932 RepID=UPI0026EFB2A2|nr:protein tyrosine phosphatase type IVA 1-like isoform X2 [Diceros bicornis minor]